MTNEEVIGKLETVTLPRIVLEAHRRELREALVNEYRIQIRSERSIFGLERARRLVWKAVIISSVAYTLAVLFIAVSVLLPRLQSQPMTARVVEEVLSSKEVIAARGNDELLTVTASQIGSHEAEVVIDSRGGVTIVRVDTREDPVKIEEITAVVLLGSIYEPEDLIIGEERNKIITFARTDPEFKKFLDDGATVSKVVKIQAIAVSRYPQNGRITQDRESWAIVDLDFRGSKLSFLVSAERNKVIDRSNRDVQ